MKEIFKVTTSDETGKDWLIAHFGTDGDGKTYILTTDDVPGSALPRYSRGAKADAELVARLLNEYIAEQGGRK